METLRDEWQKRTADARMDFDKLAQKSAKECVFKMEQLHQQNRKSEESHKNALKMKQDELIAATKKLEGTRQRLLQYEESSTGGKRQNEQLKLERNRLKSDIAKLHSEHESTRILLKKSEEKIHKLLTKQSDLEMTIKTTETMIQQSSVDKKSLEITLKKLRSSLDACRDECETLKRNHIQLENSHKELVVIQDNLQKELKVTRVKHAQELMDLRDEMETKKTQWSKMHQNDMNNMKAKYIESKKVELSLQETMAKMRSQLEKERSNAVSQFAECSKSESELQETLLNLKKEQQHDTSIYNKRLEQSERHSEDLLAKYTALDKKYRKRIDEIESEAKGKLDVLRASLDDTVLAGRIMAEHFKIIQDAANSSIETRNNAATIINVEKDSIEAIINTLKYERDVISDTIRKIPDKCTPVKSRHPEIKNAINCKAIISYRDDMFNHRDHIDKIITALRHQQSKMIKKHDEYERQIVEITRKMSELESISSPNEYIKRL